jgi:hypothetical protein
VYNKGAVILKENDPTKNVSIFHYSRFVAFTRGDGRDGIVVTIGYDFVSFKIRRRFMFLLN